MNSTFTYIEIGLVVLIIIFQIKYFNETRVAIGKLKSLLPAINQLNIDKLKISSTELAKINPKEIINNFNDYKENEFDLLDPDLYNTEDQINLFNQETTDLNLISPDKKFNTSFDIIKESLNVYLIKNKGTVADFNLIKDIIERNVEAEDEYISQTINTPLYLGLMGTMLGIIFGLFNLYFIQGSGEDIFDKGISSFLMSVAIAMIASFLGLLLTVGNSVFGYKNARKAIEANKNDLYTLIQTELMPLINQSVTSSVSTLKDILLKFNSEFGTNLGKLDKMFAKNYKTITAQATILSSLESIDINNFAKANVKVLKELKETVPNLEKFNAALNSSDRLINNTENLSREINQILQRTNDFSLIAQGIDQRIEETRTVMEYLKTHISKFESSDDLLMKWVMKADDSMLRTVTEYQKLIDQQKEGIRQMTLKEADLLERAFEENRSYFANLKYLEELNKSNIEIAENSKEIVTMKNELDAFKLFFDRTNASLEINNEAVLKTNMTLEISNEIINGVSNSLEKNNELVGQTNNSVDRNGKLIEDSVKQLKKTSESLADIPNKISVDVTPVIFKNPFKKNK